MQTSVKKLIEKYNLKCDYQTRFTDLISEIGELGKELIKGSDYGTKEYTNTSELETEIGDCLFSFLSLCEELDIDAKIALNKALNKYEDRFNKKGNIGSK